MNRARADAMTKLGRGVLVLNIRISQRRPSLTSLHSSVRTGVVEHLWRFPGEVSCGQS